MKGSFSVSSGLLGNWDDLGFFFCSTMLSFSALLETADYRNWPVKLNEGKVLNPSSVCLASSAYVCKFSFLVPGGWPSLQKNPFSFLFDTFVCNSLWGVPPHDFTSHFWVTSAGALAPVLADVQAQPPVSLAETKFPLVKNRLWLDLFLERAF